MDCRHLWQFLFLSGLGAPLGSVSEMPFTERVFAAGAPQAHGPNLSLAIIRSSDDPRAIIVQGGTVTVSIGVSNMRGDSDAHSSVLTVTLPEGLKLKQARPAANKTQAHNNVTELIWNLGTVPAKAFPRIFELDVTAVQVSVGKRLDVVATITTSDGNTDQNRKSVAFGLHVESAVADLAVESSLDAVPFTTSGPIKFTADVNNWGAVPASGSALTLTLPAKVSFQSSDPAPTTTAANVVAWQLGDIEPAGSRKVTVTITLDMSLAASVGDTTPESLLKFVFDASSTTTDANPANNHLEINKRIELAGFDLQTWLGVDGAQPGQLPVGKDATFAITYGNFGNAPAAKTSVSLSLGEGINFVSAEPAPTHSGKSDRFGGGVLTWDVGDLRVGESSLIKCHVHVASVPYYGSLVMATASAPGTDINPANNSAFFYGYPPITAGAGGLGKSFGTSQTGHARVFWRLLLLLALGAGAWFVWRKMHPVPLS